MLILIAFIAGLGVGCLALEWATDKGWTKFRRIDDRNGGI